MRVGAGYFEGDKASRRRICRQGTHERVTVMVWACAQLLASKTTVDGVRDMIPSDTMSTSTMPSGALGKDQSEIADTAGRFGSGRCEFQDQNIGVAHGPRDRVGITRGGVGVANYCVRISRVRVRVRVDSARGVRVPDDQDGHTRDIFLSERACPCC